MGKMTHTEADRLHDQVRRNLYRKEAEWSEKGRPNLYLVIEILSRLKNQSRVTGLWDSWLEESRQIAEWETHCRLTHIEIRSHLRSARSTHKAPLIRAQCARIALGMIQAVEMVPGSFGTSFNELDEISRLSG